MTDEFLVQKYRAGDEQALATLIESYLTPVYNFVYRYVGTEGDAQDITQDVFVRVWKHLADFDTDKKFKTWLFAIARNAALNWIKKKKPLLFSQFETAGGDNSLVDSLQDDSPQADIRYDNAETMRQLTSASEQLNSDYRAVLFLYYQHHLTLEEAAEVLGEPLNTVKSRHRRALLALRKLFAG